MDPARRGVVGKPEDLLVCEFGKESVNSEPVNLAGKLKGGQLGIEREKDRERE